MSPPVRDGRESVIVARDVGKMYRIYDRPPDRLKQMLFSRLGRRYGREFWALRHVSFEVRRGQTVGVIGRNGSGKSTLLQIVAATLAPTEGEVRVQGRMAALLELGSGFNPEFTGRDNVFLNGAILGLSRDIMEARLDEIAAFADIGDFLDQPVKLYSSGMFVRLAFAVQACIDPDVLIIDEALSVGDVFFQQKCTQRIRTLTERGTSILLVTHDTTAVSQLCDHVLLLENGKLIEAGSPKVVLERYMAVAYGSDRRPERLGVPEPVPPGPAPPASTMTFSPIPPTAFRHGDGGMRITGFAMHVLSGEPAAQFEPGEVVCLSLEAECHEPGLVPSVGFQFRDRFGNLVCGTNTWMLSIPMVPLDTGAMLRTTFAVQLTMGAGEYTISIALSSPDDRPERIYDWVDQVGSFTVTRSTRQWTEGLVYCPVSVWSTAAFDQEGLPADV